MTYKQVINELLEIIDTHVLINQSGYGNISDIETPETGAPNYPYVFVNPVQVNINSYGTDISLNLVVMDQALDTVEQEITTHSQCLGIVQDIISQFKLSSLYQAIDVTLSVNCSPFKQRFKDDVLGVTAQITLNVADPLDRCDAPIKILEEVIWVYNNVDNVVDGDPAQNHAYSFAGNYFNPNGDWQTNRYVVPEIGTYKMVLDMAITLVEPLPGEAMPPVPVVMQLTEGPDPLITADVMTGWPTVFVNDTQVYNIHAEWVIDATLTPGGYTWEFIWASDVPGEQSGVVQKAGSELKIFKFVL